MIEALVRRHTGLVPRTPFARQHHALVPVAGDEGSSIDNWENEGGSYLKTGALDLERNVCEAGNSFTLVGRAPIASVS
jgi:hypothetical protein